MYETINKVMAVLLITFILIIGTSVIISDLEQEDSCTDLGMKYSRLKPDLALCIEPDGTSHLTKIDCSGFSFWTKCEAQFINLGSSTFA